MTTSEEFFIVRSLQHMRTLPQREAAVYLRGLLMLCGDNLLPAGIRLALLSTLENDAQLELIASGQLKLNLEAAA